MFEYFNDKSIRAIILAQEEARRLGQNFIGSEHLLLGLIGEGTGIAAIVLKQLGINREGTRQVVEQLIGKGSGYSPATIPFTPTVKSIFEQSLQEARQLGYRTVGAGHILLAIASEGENVAAKVLSQQGVDLTKLQIEMRERLTEESATVVGSREESSIFGNRSTRKGTLAEFSTNLSQLAADGKLDPVVG
ncbi:MAG: Clp protease N-terminal domain-containing protein, partial [Prochloraceae cyanobacterium]